ncbi:hypothetical protein TorRG33x02_345400, partial [Trema orientale]
VHCVFVGYATHQKGYRCYHPPTRRLFITLDVVFHEDTLYFSKSEFQGEYQQEIQTLDYDCGIDIQGVGSLDVGGSTLDSSVTLDSSSDTSQIEQNQEMSNMIVDQDGSELLTPEVSISPS